MAATTTPMETEDGMALVVGDAGSGASAAFPVEMGGSGGGGDYVGSNTSDLAVVSQPSKGGEGFGGASGGQIVKSYYDRNEGVLVRVDDAGNKIKVKPPTYSFVERRLKDKNYWALRTKEAREDLYKILKKNFILNEAGNNDIIAKSTVDVQPPLIIDSELNMASAAEIESHRKFMAPRVSSMNNNEPSPERANGAGSMKNAFFFKYTKEDRAMALTATRTGDICHPPLAQYCHETCYSDNPESISSLFKFPIDQWSFNKAMDTHGKSFQETVLLYLPVLNFATSMPRLIPLLVDMNFPMIVDVYTVLNIYQILTKIVMMGMFSDSFAQRALLKKKIVADEEGRDPNTVRASSKPATALLKKLGYPEWFVTDFHPDSNEYFGAQEGASAAPHHPEPLEPIPYDPKNPRHSKAELHREMCQFAIRRKSDKFYRMYDMARTIHERAAAKISKDSWTPPASAPDGTRIIGGLSPYYYQDMEANARVCAKIISYYEDAIVLMMGNMFKKNVMANILTNKHKPLDIITVGTHFEADLYRAIIQDNTRVANRRVEEGIVVVPDDHPCRKFTKNVSLGKDSIDREIQLIGPDGKTLFNFDVFESLTLLIKGNTGGYRDGGMETSSSSHRQPDDSPYSQILQSPSSPTQEAEEFAEKILAEISVNSTEIRNLPKMDDVIESVDPLLLHKMDRFSLKRRPDGDGDEDDVDDEDEDEDECLTTSSNDKDSDVAVKEKKHKH